MKTETTPIPKKELEKAVRGMCRRIGAEIIRAMAYRDASFSSMGKKLGKPEKYIRHCVHDLIEGNSLDLRTISDLDWSLDVMWEVGLTEGPK